MALSRSARAGEDIKLRARFKDDLDENAQASGVFVHLYDPDVEEYVLANAFVVSGVPTYLGEGIYEYQFSVPDNGPDGIWNDRWEGILTGQPLTGSFLFEVSASGVITQLPESQLWENNLITVTVYSGVRALDGTSLESDHEFEFLTTTNPSYTNIRKVRLRTGGFLGNVEDDTIQMAILEASLEADVLTFSDAYYNLNMFRHARREYVTCLASSVLMDNLSHSMLRTKTLDNLHVEYDTNGIRDAMRGIQECLERWQPQLMMGGGSKAATAPEGVVKGTLDPDRPFVSRSWQSTEGAGVSRRIPAANTREKPTQYHRRHLTTFKKRWW